MYLNILTMFQLKRSLASLLITFDVFKLGLEVVEEVKREGLLITFDVFKFPTCPLYKSCHLCLLITFDVFKS